MRKLGAAVSCQFEGKQYLCRKRKSANFDAVTAWLCRGGRKPDWHFTATERRGYNSFRIMSSMACRLRMRLNLSPRTSASAGNGREL